MNMKKFLQRLLARLRAPQKPSQHAAVSSNGQGEAIMLVQMLQRTEEIELSCDEVFAMLDEYAEMASKGEDVGHLMPLIKQHLEMCPDCREEYEALARVLTMTNSVSKI